MKKKIVFCFLVLLSGFIARGQCCCAELYLTFLKSDGTLLTSQDEDYQFKVTVFDHQGGNRTLENLHFRNRNVDDLWQACGLSIDTGCGFKKIEILVWNKTEQLKLTFLNVPGDIPFLFEEFYVQTNSRTFDLSMPGETRELKGQE